MKTDRLIINFMRFAEKAKNPQDIADAIKTLPAEAGKQIADFIIEFCRDRGIDPQATEIQNVYTLTAEYKAAQETEANRAALDRAVTEIEAITKEFRGNQKRGALPDQEQLNALTERIRKSTAGLGAAQSRKRIYTHADYLSDCLNYDPSKDFTPALFGGLAFPDGTTSYIGARTSRGKTTAMVNIAREALDANRKTIFITLEMSGKQILNKLILSSALAASIRAGQGTTMSAMTDPARQIYAVLKKGDLPAVPGNTDIPKLYREYVTTADNQLDTAQKLGAFILFDGRGASEPEIINFITAQAEKGTVILLDYIQKMPPKPGTDTDSFRRVQAVSYDVVNAAAATNTVIIAGAQFNRLGGSDALGDCFDDQSFREAGDIEQDAHNAIGIGWTPDKQSRFYEVLKTREDNKQGTLHNLVFDGGFSYMGHGERTYRPEEQSKKPPKKETKPATPFNKTPPKGWGEWEENTDDEIVPF